jgi:hypothetical protein
MKTKNTRRQTHAGILLAATASAIGLGVILLSTAGVAPAPSANRMVTVASPDTRIAAPMSMAIFDTTTTIPAPQQAADPFSGNPLTWTMATTTAGQAGSDGRFFAGGSSPVNAGQHALLVGVGNRAPGPVTAQLTVARPEGFTVRVKAAGRSAQVTSVTQADSNTWLLQVLPGVDSTMADLEISMTATTETASGKGTLSFSLTPYTGA